ncbi:hypothetical protein OG819_40315 [Streptomyces sp. NBC_01549]|uniref:hypothetical protein n=1 Tax=Streptomyces sp. NBC_01549 TaxID=2975874 RepID=UPI00224EBAC6|nr:hypothetical protein [Streptomyces sp. NBC_01549]MCX4595692.1 hypothetical protein [Streptomyces sp. NBC_01549]
MPVVDQRLAVGSGHVFVRASARAAVDPGGVDARARDGGEAAAEIGALGDALLDLDLDGDDPDVGEGLFQFLGGGWGRGRTLAALEAVVGNDDGALTALAGGAGERPLPALLAAYGKHTLHHILLSVFGIDATMDHAETCRLVAEMNGDPAARITYVLTDALHNQLANPSFWRSMRSPTPTLRTPNKKTLLPSECMYLTECLPSCEKW